MSTTPAATLERRGSVALITLNRPEAMNAVNGALALAVGEAIEELASDPGLRVGVITGAGRAFCAGADLKEVAAGRTVEAPGHPEWGFAGITRHFVEKPLIAAVNGFALGGGTEVALACDLVVASSEAHFGLPEVTRGLIAAAGGVLRMPRQLPFKLALELALTGEPITATQARDHGLVNRVRPPDDVLDTALQLARRIAGNAPLAVQASKRLLHTGLGLGWDWDEASWIDNDEKSARIFASQDAREGARAFAEKRTPHWSGR